LKPLQENLSRQAAKDAKKDFFLVFPNLGAFASLRESSFLPILP
jgi:hypothetical protein